MAAVGTPDYQGDRSVYTGIPGVNDNDIVIETGDVGNFDTFELMSTAGSMDVEVTLDGANFSTAPLSLADLGAITLDPVLATAANRVYGFTGNFAKIRIRQSGATAVADPVLRAYSSKR